MTSTQAQTQTPSTTPFPAPTVRLRALGPDEPDVVREVFAGLSPESRYRRFHGHVDVLTDRMVAALADVDGSRQRAVVAEVAAVDGWRPVGLGRVVRTSASEAELALEVVDGFQGKGLGRRLVERLRQEAAAAGFDRVVASVLVGNHAMLHLLVAAFPDAWITSDGRTWEVAASVPPLPRPRRRFRLLHGGHRVGTPAHGRRGARRTQAAPRVRSHARSSA